jgi:DNA-binding ferritin-like protein
MTNDTEKETDGSVKLAVGQIMSDVRHIGDNIKLMRTDAKEHREEVKEALTAQSARITELEKFMWKVVGITALFAIVGPLVVAIALGVLDGP